GSRELILFCSENATRSRWVKHEIDYWLDAPHRGRLLLVVTEGVDPDQYPEQIFPRRIIEQGLHKGMWFDFRAGRSKRRRREFKANLTTLGAALYDLDQREVQHAVERFEHQQRWIFWLGVFGVLALLAAYGLWTWQAQRVSRAKAMAADAQLM